jgi:hypothetical protein
MTTRITKTLQKGAVSLAMGAVAFSTFGFALALPFTASAVVSDPNTSCNTITLVSGSATQTAGYTSTNPMSAPLQASAYSGSGWAAATTTQPAFGWIDPTTDSHFSGSGASWVSTSAVWPSASSTAEGATTTDQWRLFRDSFTLPQNATVTSATISYAADNALAIYLGGTMIASTNAASTSDDVYATSTSSNGNYNQVFTSSFTPVAGTNSLDFVLRNWNSTESSNPTGLLYKATINYCTPVSSSSTHTVTVMKYIDGMMATASSSMNMSFPMMTSWNSMQSGSTTQSGSFMLSMSGYGTTTPYTAVIPNLMNGSMYSASEATSSTTGVSCASGMPFRTVGYTSGNSAAEAMAASATTTVPSFSNLGQDKYVIVWNQSCPGNGGSNQNGSLAVTSITPVQTIATADGTFADGWVYTFNITVPATEPDIALKFSDWASMVGSNTMPVANNIRISSMQASATSTVMLTAANAYSIPSLHIVRDLDPNMPGMQVQVKVEVAIPSGTVNGSYTTNYGVRSL